MAVILVPFGHFWKFLVFWTFESFGLLVMTDTLYMWSVWTLLVTFKTLDNGAQVKGSLTFVLVLTIKPKFTAGFQPSLVGLVKKLIVVI